MSASQLAFFDTNILVYAFDRGSDQKREQASSLVRQNWQDQQGCLSVQILQEFYVTVTQKIRQPLEHSVARQMVADFGRWKTHAPNEEDVLSAIDLQKEFQLSFWDAMVLQSALALNCSVLYSEDFSHEQRFRNLEVRNPLRG